MAGHQGLLFRQLSDDVVIVVHDGVELPDEEVEKMGAIGVRFEHGTPQEVVTSDDSGLVGLRLADGSVLDVAVHGGFVQVSGDVVSILSDVAELGDQIDRARAQAAKERAEESLRSQHDAEATAALSRAHARLAASGGMVGMPGSH